MGNFNRGGGFGGNKGFNNDRGSFRDRDRSDRPQMHQATCSECGKDCTVPFKPTGSKPVFCSNCFGKKEGGSNNRFERRGSDRPSFGDKQMFKATCDKCHEVCEVPFKPSGDKPVFCNNCFAKADRGGATKSAGADQYQKQFEMLNTKLDNIMKILSPNFKAEKVVKEVKEAKPTKKVVAKKVVVVKKPAKKTASKKKK